ncbi:MAG TPA: hypothetical protein VIG50_07570 [Vicinamibacteria bacterium]|jgi:hypothetical protein
MGGPDWSVEEVPHFDWAVRGSAGSADLEVPETSDEHWRHAEHRIHQGMDVLHTIELIETWQHVFHAAGHAGHAVEVGAGLAWPEVAGVTAAEVGGGVAVVVVTALELYRAFTVGQRIQEQKGVTYGLMWEVLGVKDVERTTKGDPFGPGEISMSESEREAWQEGIAEGRALADKTVNIGGKLELVDGFPKMVGGKEVKVRELIEATLAYEMALQGKDPLTDPHQKAWNVAVDKTLNRVWEQVRETSERWGERSLNRQPLSWIGDDNGFPQPAPKP